MKSFYPFLFAALTATSAQAQKAVIMSSPKVPVVYLVSQLSPNGKWAVGNFDTGYMQGFVWDLTTNKIRTLAPLGDNSAGLSISNDGKVAGVFMDDKATDYGVPILNGGYWHKGYWHHLSNKGDAISDLDNGSQLQAISPNGRWIGGIARVGSSWQPIAWDLETNKFEIYPSSNGAGSIYAIGDKGQAAGYTYHHKTHNRTPIYWGSTAAADSVWIDAEHSGPYELANAISSDGSKVVSNQHIYDVATKTKKSIFDYEGLEDCFSWQIYGINKQGTIYGSVQMEMGTSFKPLFVKDGKSIDIVQHLTSLGADLSRYMVLWCTGVSDDEKTFSLMTYSLDDLSLDEPLPKSIIVKLDENTVTPAPVALEARHLHGINGVQLTWDAPLFAETAPSSYEVYRNNAKIGSITADKTIFVDSNVANGEYTYSVKAVYADASSAPSVEAAITVAESPETAPQRLEAEYRGVSNAFLAWDAPAPRKNSVNYYSETDNIYSIGGGIYDFECAVRFKRATLDAYKAKQQKITEVAFYPMSRQKSWTINIYKDSDTQTPIYTQNVDGATLNYGKENYVKLTTPVEIPTEGELIVGINIVPFETGSYKVVGLVDGIAEPGYTDLMRRKGQNELEFYSLYERSLVRSEGGVISENTFPISLVFNEENAGNENDVKEYNVKQDGKLVATTSATSALIPSLAEGNYEFTVSPVYNNGEEGPAASTNLTIELNADNIPAVNNINVTTEEGKMTATWDEPVDDSRAILTYSSDVNTGGMVGDEAHQFSYMVTTIYEGNKIRNFDGNLIKSFRFYPLASADFTFYLMQDGEIVAEKYVEDYNLNAWNEVKLDEPIAVNRNSTYQLTLDCYDVEPEKAPLGMDDRLAMPGISDLYSLDNGQSFSSLTYDGGKSANWMMGITTGTAETQPLAFDGYDVRIDGKKANEETLTEPTFSYTFDANGTHRISVSVLYPDPIGEFTGDTKFFTISITGIENAVADALQVNLNGSNSVLRVEGVTASSIEAFSANGRKVASATGNEINVSSLTPGTYVIRITTETGKQVARTVIIK